MRRLDNIAEDINNFVCGFDTSSDCFLKILLLIKKGDFVKFNNEIF